MTQYISLQGGRFTASPSLEKRFAFDIDPAHALFVKEGENLIIRPTEGAPTVIEGFFSSLRAGGDAEFVLADGTTMSGKDFFQAYSPAPATVMGPAVAPLSSGNDTFDDEAAGLIGGVDGFDAANMADDAQPLRASHPGASVSLVAGLPGSGLPDDEDSPIGPQPPAAPDCRFVLRGNAAEQVSRAPGIDAVPPANDNSASIVSVGDGAYGTAQLPPDGSAIGSSLIDAEADDELVILEVNFSLDGQARIAGGAGFDVFKFDAGLSFFDFTGQLTGLEFLDPTDGAQEIILGLDDIRAPTDDASGVGRGETSRIRGDKEDTVRPTGSGWKTDTGNRVTLTEPDGSTLTYYTASNGTTTVYIDEQIRLDLLSITG